LTQSNQVRGAEPFLELKGIQKWFGGVHALRGIDLTLTPGQAYHLLGENGCGKSTVIKIMSGAIEPSDGSIVLGGSTFASLTPIQALGAGIETVYQDLSLLPNLTVAENVALNEQLVGAGGRLARLFDRKKLRQTAERALAAAGLPGTRDFLGTIASDLPLASRQLVAIARAIATRAKLVIMDEPTTSLTRREVDNLIDVVERLRAENVAVLFVTHKLDECYRIGGNAIVFRDGRCVAQGPIASYTKKQISELMTGRSIDGQRYRSAQPMAETLLQVRDLEAPGMHEISFSLRKGEILGITGLADSGRNELATALAGVFPAASGEMILEGKTVHVHRPAGAIACGIGYIPEDRLAEGLFLDKSIRDNEIALIIRRLSNAVGILDQRQGRDIASRLSEEMHLNTKNLDLPVGSLSGGNQQRVLIGRALTTAPKLLVLHGPTVGVDVGSKDMIYQTIQRLAESGMGLIVISDDLPELLQNADRILVMNSGRIVAEFDAGTSSEDQLYRAFLTSVPETMP
jgi:simple sugar transport system ATP-binding protein